MALTKPWLGLYCIIRSAERTIETLLKSIDGVFDEVVIVDTGSTDGTKDLVEKHFGLTPGSWDRRDSIELGSNGGIQRLVLANFEWVHDFSKARQFSYDLGTAKWRCYLDADDDASDFKTKLRPTMERTEKDHPESNCISVKYNYVPNEMAQDTIRIVRWDAGWTFEDPVHEHLVRTDPSQGRVISKYTDIWVKHQPAEPQLHANSSFERNVLIAEKAYQEATRPEKKALWAYYLGNYAYEVGKLDLAREYYRKMADELGRNNITCEGLCRWARMEMKQGNYEKAMTLAGEAISKAPELPDGYVTLGIALNLAGDTYRAAGLFDFVRAQPKPPMETQHDAVWLDGMANAHAAQAYYQIGRISDANLALDRVPVGLVSHPEIFAATRKVHSSLTKTEGFHRLHALWEYLIWDTEPLKAKRLLEEFCPAAFSDSPQVQALKRQMNQKLAHMEDWRAYQRAYAAIPELPYHVPKEHHAWTLTRGRARMVRQWAENQPKTGEPIEVLVIGVQDGIIETAMLEANPRVVLTACDVAPQASVGINAMIEKFPGRVKTHALVDHHFDWFPPGSEFDAIILFEVIEHLPELDGDDVALREIHAHLKPQGQLFLSTPIASMWVETYLSDTKSPRPWWHVRAHNPTSLWTLFQDCGFTGSLIGLSEETLFLAKMQKAPKQTSDEVAIYVYPQRPMTEGFDPFSPKLEHCGGSEEAVIHLSAALARKGVRVTVYTDMPARGDQMFVHEGCQWRGHDELDVASLNGTLLVWRAPQLAADFKKQNPNLLIFNWLHDTHYVQPPEVYEAVDGTIALSKFHAEAVRQLDKYEGRLLQAANGIDPLEFPEPDESKRDPHACIYAAAPERGLDLLLEAWPLIRKEVPDATLRVYYSWDLTEKMLKRRPNADLTALLAKLRAGFEALKDQGVTYLGGVGHKVLHEAYRTSGIWSYPPNRFNEISCISALKAQASGCWPVIVPTGALPETCPTGTHVSLGDHLVVRYAAAVVKSMKHSATLDRKTGREFALAQSWDAAADKFLEHFRAPNKRITIYAGHFGRKFGAHGSADGRPLGGSEEAVIAMAKALGELGHEVFVYAHLPEGTARQTTPTYGATWRDASTFDPAGPHGTLLAWRCPSMMSKLKDNGYPVILWLMDPQYGAHGFDYAEADDVVFLTETHKDIIRRKDGFDGGGSVVHIGLPELPLFGENTPKRDPKAVMWATSPDRGLLEFLKEVWPKVLEEVPDAHLHVFYGLEPLRKNGKSDLADAIAAELEKLIDSATLHGGVPDDELYEWYQKCGVFAYRSVGFEETQSLSVIKAQALGCFPIVNQTGCLPEVIHNGDGGIAVTDENYVKVLVDELQDPTSEKDRHHMAIRSREFYSVEKMAEKMLAVIRDVRGDPRFEVRLVADPVPAVAFVQNTSTSELPPEWRVSPRPTAPGAP